MDSDPRMNVDEEEDDPIIKEIDVYLANSLADKVYILQYPIRPSDKSYDKEHFLGARVKPKHRRIELDIAINTQSDNYSKPKGEQFALNVDGKASLISPTIASNFNKAGSSSSAAQISSGSFLGGQASTANQKYYRTNFMDKQVLCSTNGALGTMNRFYQLGMLKGDQLDLTPVQSVLQMKPSFEYFDIYEQKVKEVKDSQQGDTDYSTEEEPDGESEKAELVTLKYSQKGNQSQQEPEENWINAKFINTNDVDAAKTRELLFCKNRNVQIPFPFSQSEFIDRLVDRQQNEHLKQIVKAEVVDPVLPVDPADPRMSIAGATC